MGADAARTMKRSKAIVNRMETQISEKEKLLKDIEYIDSLTMNSQASHHKRLLSVEDLQLGYENLLFEPIHFTIEPHQRVAISGPNGAGKSSIIHYLLGAFNGKVIGEKYQPKHLSISYASQNYEDNRGTLAEFAEKKPSRLPSIFEQPPKAWDGKRCFS